MSYRHNYVNTLFDSLLSFSFLSHKTFKKKYRKQSVDTHIKEEDYDASKDSVWIDRICETCMKGLADLKKPYKYVGTFFLACYTLLYFFTLLLSFSISDHTVTCTILQRNGAGIHTTSSYFWDGVCDVECTIRYPGIKSKDQKRRLCCLVSVGCFAICRP